MPEPTRTAIGTWSGGRFMHFGEPLDDERMVALLRPDERPAHGHHRRRLRRGRGRRGCSAARSTASRATRTALVGAVGHDFYEGEREGAKGFPRFTDPRLRGPEATATTCGWPPRRSLERIGADAFDLLLLHNPDRTGYTSEAVWDGMAALRDAGLTRRLGIAPGPANGFTLDLLDCFERFGDADRLGDGDPEPARAVAGRARARRRRAITTSRLITRVVDYGGLFHDDVLPGTRVPAVTTTAAFRPDGWVERGRAKLDAMRPIAAAPRAHAAPARLPVEPRARRGALRRADADPGGGAGRAAGRGQARRAGRAARPTTC